MNKTNRTVAIVGRPNVGKSRLFNRLARRRISIVHDQPGVTRDIVSAETADGYLLLDTGGMGLDPGDTPKEIVSAVDNQVLFAISAAPVIVLVVDGQQPLTAMDQTIAEKLRTSGKPVLLVVNKIDHDRQSSAWEEFYALGLGEPLEISAEHGRGESDLRERIQALLAEHAGEEEAVAPADRRLKLCFIGKPNVGKSSLSNRLLKSERLIVSPVPGTTRESIELDFDYTTKKGAVWKFRLTDTAGLKHRTKIASPIEYFSQLRSLGSIRDADVVFMVVDAVEGVDKSDKAIAGEAVKEHKPLIVVVNKWDLALDALEDGRLEQYESESAFRRAFGEAVNHQLFFSPGSPVVFVSALKGLEIDRMLKAARDVDAKLATDLPTARLNQVLSRLTETAPPPRTGGKRFRIFYAVQTGHRPFRIRLFCNQERRLTDTYRRYLESGVVEEFGLQGCPVLFDLVGKEKRYTESDR